jgi:hypothetical protein
MTALHNPPLVEIYALDEFYSREPVAGVQGAFRRLHQPYIVFANVFGDALKKLELARSVKITPYDGSWEGSKFEHGEQPKYFIYKKTDGAQALADIHIFRHGEYVCPKQDLTFALRTGDIIVPGMLIC